MSLEITHLISSQGEIQTQAVWLPTTCLTHSTALRSYLLLWTGTWSCMKERGGQGLILWSGGTHRHDLREKQVRHPLKYSLHWLSIIRVSFLGSVIKNLLSYEGIQEYVQSLSNTLVFNQYLGDNNDSYGTYMKENKIPRSGSCLNRNPPRGKSNQKSPLHVWASDQGRRWMAWKGTFWTHKIAPRETEN